MFGSGFDLGFDLTDIQGQITALLGNAVVTGLVVASLALVFAPRILGLIKRVIRR